MKRSNSADVLSRWATSSDTASYPVAIAARHVQNKSRNLTGPFVVADVITGTSKAMLAPKGTLLDTRTATQDAHFTYRHPLPNDGRPVINGSVGVARFSELVDTEGDRCLPKGAAPRRHTRVPPRAVTRAVTRPSRIASTMSVASISPSRYEA